MVDFSRSSHKEDKTNKLSIYDLDESLDKGNRLLPSMVLTHRNENVLEGLNPEQVVMVKGIIDYLDGKLDIPYFLCQGGGGTGKSYSINRALSGIDPKFILAAAPSHFAKNVLKDFLGEAYKVITVAALLGKKVSYDDDGKEILIRINPGMDPPIVNHQIIIIDEGSMVEDSTAIEILSYVADKDKYLIILGDYCQLPPVNQDADSLFFNLISAELTIPMRFQGPIFYLAGVLRKEIIKIRSGLVPSLNIINIETNRVSHFEETGSGYIFLNNFSILIRAAIKRFQKNRGTGYVRLLAYRNKTIDKLNFNIRVGLFGDTPKQFEHGELIISSGGYSKKTTRNKDKQIILNGELFKVKSAEEVVGPYGIKCMQLLFQDRVFEEPIYAVSTEGEVDYKETLKRLTGLAKEYKHLWRDVFVFKESFAYFNYSYAASVHKAQGSSIDHVYIMEDDIMGVKLTTTKEKLQSMYVAVSRGKFRVYIYNNKFKVDNSNLSKEVILIDSV